VGIFKASMHKKRSIIAYLEYQNLLKKKAMEINKYLLKDDRDGITNI
jgi:hypothetical protein